jgi:hypothetical protein
MPTRKNQIILTKSDGETDTLQNWAKRIGMSSRAIMWRINKKEMSIDDALDPKLGNAKLLLTANGETGPIPFWSRKTGIKDDTIRYRVKSGWTDSQALGFSPPPETVEFQGEFLNPSQIARNLGITRQALQHRLKVGWKPDDAFSLGNVAGIRGKRKGDIESLRALLADIHALKIDEVEALFERYGIKPEHFAPTEER